MPPKSAVERSQYRKEIENLILEAKSSRYISDWLKEQKEPENISHNAINNYKKNKFNVKAEAVTKYREKQSKKRLDKAVHKTVSSIEYLDTIIETANKTGLSVNEEQGVTALDIHKLGVQAVKAKHDITKDEPDNVFNLNLGVENNVNIPKDPGIRARGRDFIRSIRAGQNESRDSSNGDK